MSSVALALRPGYASALWVDRGVSEDALTVSKSISTASDFSGSVAVGEPKHIAQEQIDLAFEEARVDDWDGMGSAAVEPSTDMYAGYFLSLLPITTPMPEITVDRDGDMCFEWDNGPRQVLSVCVGRDGTITYAGLFGHSRSYGTEHLAEAVPDTVSANIIRVTSATPR